MITTDANRMVEIVKQREISVRIYTSNGNGQQKILDSDVQRVYIRFRPSSLPSYPTPYPSLLPIGADSAADRTVSEEYKFVDCPGIVTGEWYIFSTDALENIEIITERYSGD